MFAQARHNLNRREMALLKREANEFRTYHGLSTFPSHYFARSCAALAAEALWPTVSEPTEADLDQAAHELRRGSRK